MTLFRSLGARKDATRGTAAIEVRKDLMGIFASTGVLPGSASPLVSGAATFAYTVNAGRWVTSRGASDGYHLWGNDGAVSITLSDTGATLAAPGSNSRIDIIYAIHPSASENGDTVSEPSVAVAKGTAASTPVAPTIPTGALELARNTMTSAATSTNSAGNTITQSAARASVVGVSSITDPVRTLYTPSGQSIPDATWTGVSFGANTLPGDTGNGAGGVAVSGSTWTFGKAGIYSVTFSAGFGATSTVGTREARLLLNGATVLDYDRAYSSNPQTRLKCSFTGAFAASDTLVGQVNQTSGGALALLTTVGAVRIDITYLRPVA